MKPALKIAEPVDPKLEAILDRLFVGKQSKDLGNLIKKYARFHLDSPGEWIASEALVLELQQMLEYARECVEEAEAEDRKYDHVDNGDWEHGG